MTMHVIGAGVGRTGTYSLKLATNQLGLGPCHHMEAVLNDMATQVPLWNAALNGQPDWQAIYAGFDMADGIIAKTGFPTGLDHDALVKAFIAHNEAVKATVPSRQLLVYEVKDGWDPLCSFIGVAPPAEPFPRTNHRAEFWDRVTGRI
jgi:hypothetical protein